MARQFDGLKCSMRPSSAGLSDSEDEAVSVHASFAMRAPMNVSEDDSSENENDSAHNHQVLIPKS